MEHYLVIPMVGPFKSNNYCGSNTHKYSSGQIYGMGLKGLCFDQNYLYAKKIYSGLRPFLLTRTAVEH